MVQYYEKRKRIMIKLRDWFIQKREGKNNESYQELVRGVTLNYGTPKSLLDKLLKENWGYMVDENGELVKL